MSKDNNALLRAIPSLDKLLRSKQGHEYVVQLGQANAASCLRFELEDLRRKILDSNTPFPDISEAVIFQRVEKKIYDESFTRLRPVFNLTGTILHTNLGRALLPATAIEAVRQVAQSASNVEYNLESGVRGDRDTHINKLICKLTGAEDATVVNNNAAAVMLMLNTLAPGLEVATSRGELVEIGGSFRMPDIMRSSGCVLREVGTTNRTHLHDYEEAIGSQTALVMKVHTSNFEVTGFTAKPSETDIAKLCKAHHIPFVIDLGSGSLLNMRKFGLPHEPTVGESLMNGADLVTFSGDKLLGGPQAGIIAGRADLIARIKKNPMKRALRVDKMRIAALSCVLELYTDEDRLCEQLPTLKHLLRCPKQLHELALRLQPLLKSVLPFAMNVSVEQTQSQVGSGALPTHTIESVALSIGLSSAEKFLTLSAIETILRKLPIPIIGRIHADRLWLDLRCLDDEDSFSKQLHQLPSLLTP